MPLDAPLHQAIGGGRVPGITAAVVADGAIAGAGGVGTADEATGRVLTVETPLLWFSMTKIATATAAMQLADRGALRLDDTVERLVPGVLPASARDSVLVRHLLQHSSGIPNPPPIRWVRPAAESPPDPDAFLRTRFARVRKLRFPPGSRAAYTNLGYLLLGSVISAAAGKPFPDVVRDDILTPLGMHDTSFDLPAAPSPAVAVGHQRMPRGGGPLLRVALPPGIVGPRAGKWMTFRPFLVNGASYGGLVGPVADAARLVLVHANGGAVDGVRILSEEAARAMRTVSVDGKPFDHGLGWFRPPAARASRPSFVEHYGGGGGYHNLMRLYPDRGVGVVVMGNSTSYDVDAVVDALAAPLLDR